MLSVGQHVRGPEAGTQSHKRFISRLYEIIQDYELCTDFHLLLEAVLGKGTFTTLNCCQLKIRAEVFKKVQVPVALYEKKKVDFLKMFSSGFSA